MEPGVNVSVSYEFVRRVIERNILPSAALDAARNPLSITKIVYDAKGRPSQQLIGKYATVVINPRDGRLVTTWRTKRKLAEKLGAKLINSKPQLRPTRPDGLSKGFGTALLMLSILDMTAGDANAAEIDWWNIDGDADGIPASVDPDDHVVSCCTEKDKIACWDDYAERLQYVWKEEIRFTWFGLSTTREWVYNFSWKRESDRKLEQCFKDCDLGDKENGHAVDSNKR